MINYFRCLLVIACCLLLTAPLLFFTTKTRAQDTTWRCTYGGDGYDEGRAVIQTFDGSFLVAGATSSFGYGASDVYVIKVDSASNTDDSLIVWNEKRKLSWNDYKMTPPHPAPGAAATTVTLDFDVKKINGKYIFSAHALFSPLKSWVLPNKTKDSAVLVHERLHFDIVEIHARELRKFFIDYEGAYTVECAEVFQKKFESVRLAMESENLQYDCESNHYFNIPKQKKWEQNVALRLKMLANYK